LGAWCERGRATRASRDQTTHPESARRARALRQSGSARGCFLHTAGGPRPISTRNHETAIYLLSGDEVELWTGEHLERREVAHPGDYLYIPAGVPHVAVNRSETPAIFIAARTDPNEQESVVLRPDLEAKVP
jgi:mannose-6-phosphate isomerase-like protein (cupin superfamily)